MTAAFAQAIAQLVGALAPVLIAAVRKGGTDNEIAARMMAEAKAKLIEETYMKVRRRI